MSSNISNKNIVALLNRNLNRARQQKIDAISKTSTGKVFTKDDPKPARRLAADQMEYKIRSLTTAKQNVNDVISLLNTAGSAMSELGNIITRMKEINVNAASSSVGDLERRYLLVEYDALYDEINRITLTTDYKGLPLLYGESEKVPEELVFRLGDPSLEESISSSGEDINTIVFSDIKNTNTTTEALGIYSVKDYLEDLSYEEGIYLEDVKELLIPEEEDLFSTRYDEALARLSGYRANYGALHARLNRTLDYMDVYQQNIQAAQSKITDTDYALEAANLAQAEISFQANTALLMQANIDSASILKVLTSTI